MTAPLCRDCRWFGKPGWFDLPRCQHVAAFLEGDEDYVYGRGKKKPDVRLLCSSARELRINCGPEGKNFEARPLLLPSTGRDEDAPHRP